REIDFLARLQAHVRLLPATTPADETAEPLFLALDDRDLDRVHLDLPHQLDRRLHFGLGRVRGHAKDHLRMLVRNERGLFRNDRGQQHRHQALRVVFLHVAGRGAHASISSNCVTAPLVSSTFLKRTRLTGSTSRVSSTSTSCRLRDDRYVLSSRLSVTTSTLPVRPKALIRCANCLGLGGSSASGSLTARG